MKFLMPPPDPRHMLRQAMSDGSAHHEDKAQVDGRTVERIRIDPASTCPFPTVRAKPTYVYVDPETSIRSKYVLLQRSGSSMARSCGTTLSCATTRTSSCRELT